MKRFYSVFNLIIVILLIIWNYLSNTGIVNEKTIGTLSREYENLFTPAGYAFSIWGIIFFGLLATSAYQIKKVFLDKSNNEFVLKIGPWFSIANIANGLWVYAWLKEYTGLSVIIMLSILISLLIIIIRLNMERAKVQTSFKVWAWWPIGIYAGWITVASVANVSAWLAKHDWEFLFSETLWTMIMIIIAAIINLLMIRTRQMRDFALVGIWSLTAITIRHWGSIPEIQWTALVCIAIISMYIILHWYQKLKLNRTQ
jgi:hypothetical protein